jgi:hypothetical protein
MGKWDASKEMNTFTIADILRDAVIHFTSFWELLQRL